MGQLGVGWFVNEETPSSIPGTTWNVDINLTEIIFITVEVQAVLKVKIRSNTDILMYIVREKGIKENLSSRNSQVFFDIPESVLLISQPFSRILPGKDDQIGCLLLIIARVGQKEP